MRLLRLLALRHVRLRPLRAGLAVVAVAAGTAMAVSVLVVRSSVERSVEEFGRALSGPTELRVVGAVRRGGLEPSVARAVAATDGVAATVPLVQGVMVTELSGSGRPEPPPGAGSAPGEDTVLVLGVDCRVEILVGPFGCRDDMVADHGDRPLSVGPGVDPRVGLRTQAGVVPLAFAPVEERLDGVARGEVVVFGMDTARRLLARGSRLDVVYVEPERGVATAALADRLDRVVGEHNGVLSAREGPPEVASALDNVLPLFTLLALFALGVGAMLVYNTAALSVEERRRDLAVVGALGGTRRAVAVATLGEAAITGAAGGALGAVGGVLVAGPIVASLSGFTARVAGIPLAVHVAAGVLVVGAALGVAVSLLAAIPAVRRALRADVAAELSGRARGDDGAAPAVLRRAAAWAVVVGVGLGGVWIGTRRGGLEPWQVPAGGLGFAVCAIGLLLCGANLSALAVRPLARLADRWAAGRLAVANLVRDPRRTGVMTAAVAAAATTAFVTAGYSNGVRAALTDDLVANLRGVEVSSVAVGANANLDTGLTPAIVSGLAAIPGVDEVDLGASVLAGSGRGGLISVVAFEDPWLTDGKETVRGTIDLDRFRAGEALVNTALARDEGLRPGDVVRLPTPGGMAEVPVHAVVGGGGTTNRAVHIPWDLHRRLYGPQPVRSVVLRPAPGLSIDELAAKVRAAALSPSLRIRTPVQLIDEAADSAEAQIAPFWTLQRGLLAVSFVAVLSTLLLVGVQRQREMGVLGAVGMEPGSLGRMVVAEAAVVALAAVALGAVGGLVMLWALVQVAPLLIGYSTPYAPAWSALVRTGAVAVVVTLVASLWPARRAARTPVVAVLRDE